MNTTTSSDLINPFLASKEGFHYRYAYNGMESDGEVSGAGNSYTTEFRQYDPRLGRWKSLDPLMMKFPWMSPYVAFNNNPIYFVDPLGLEGTKPTEEDKKNGSFTSDSGTCYEYDNESDSWFREEVTAEVEAPYGPTPMEGAELSKDSYNEKSSANLPGKWKEVESLPDGIKLKKDVEGFKSRMYQRERLGKLEYAYVFAGTDEMSQGGKKDWKNNWHQIWGNSRQYRRAVKNTKRFNEGLEGKITLVGHSLGGGLATAAAEGNGNKAIIFNPAWLSAKTRRNYGIGVQLSRVESYVVEYEILNFIQNNMNYNMIYDGSNLTLLTYQPLQSKIDGSWDYYLFGIPTGGVFYLMLESHGINTVIKALKENGY